MKAIITVTRKVEYSSIVEIPEEIFDRLDAALEGTYAESKAAEEELNEMIDIRDWQDDELYSLDEFKRYTDEG